MGGGRLNSLPPVTQAFSSVSEMVINTNQWEVHDANDPVILKRIVKQHVRPFLVR